MAHRSRTNLETKMEIPADKFMYFTQPG